MSVFRMHDDRLLPPPRGQLIARFYLLLGRGMGYPGGFNN
jgi:hypothetical protein